MIMYAVIRHGPISLWSTRELAEKEISRISTSEDDFFIREYEIDKKADYPY